VSNIQVPAGQEVNYQTFRGWHERYHKIGKSGCWLVADGNSRHYLPRWKKYGCPLAKPAVIDYPPAPIALGA
jgi:hypothetical protein